MSPHIPMQASLALTRSLPAASHVGVDLGAQERTWIHIPTGMALHDVEQFYIRATLDLHGGDRRAAAAALGISLKTLYNRIPVPHKDGRA